MPLQPVQQGIASQSAGAKASLPSTWSDHSVDISLDFLGPGMHPPKPSQPTLNTLQQGERKGRAGANCDTVARLFSKAPHQSHVIYNLALSFTEFVLSFPGNQAPANMLSQGFSVMSLGPPTIRQPVNPMMHPGAGTGMGMGMGMAPNQGMMVMGMNMGMPGSMGMGMGMMNPAMVQQPKHDAFADFANFGK